VKANVLFFDKKPGREQAWTSKLWVYDLRTNMHFTLKQNPIRKDDFREFINSFKAGGLPKRKATWSETNPEGRWRAFDYEELLTRDKLSLDLFWLKDESLDDGESLPEPDVIAAEIADDLEAAMEQFAEIANDLRGSTP
jgi:type I restriction enzyme M protein